MVPKGLDFFHDRSAEVGTACLAPSLLCSASSFVIWKIVGKRCLLAGAARAFNARLFLLLCLFSVSYLCLCL